MAAHLIIPPVSMAAQLVIPPVYMKTKVIVQAPQSQTPKKSFTTLLSFSHHTKCKKVNAPCVFMVMTHKGLLNVPPGFQSDSFKSYVDLARKSSNCAWVDMINGTWFFSIL